MKKLITLSIILVLGYLSVDGQSTAIQDTSGIPAENVEVIKNYEATISQARKKNIKINREEKTYQNIPFSYKLDNITEVDFDRPEPKISALSYKDKKKRKEDIKDGTLYGAYGNFKTLKAGGAYSYFIEDWLETGFKVDHYSADGDNSIDIDRSNKTAGNLYVSYFLSPKNKVGVEFFGSRLRHYSENGLARLNTDSASTNQHGANLFGGSLNYAHTSFEKTGLAIRTKLSYDILNQTVIDATENLLSGSVNVIKKINDVSNIEVPFLFNNYNGIDSSLNRSDLVLQPALNYKAEKFKLKAGVEYIKADSNFIFPIIDVTYPNAVAGIDFRFFTASDFKRNSFHFLADAVPYFSARNANLSPNYSRSFNLNITKPINQFTFGLTSTYTTYTNELFVSLGSGAFLFNYDINYLNRKEFSLTPEIGFQTENIHFNLNARYNFFIDQPERQPLAYRPQFLVGLSGKQYLFNDKLKLKQSITYNSSRTAYNPNDFGIINPSETLKRFVDISLGLDYRINKTFSVFVEGTNLLGSDYFIWYRNPVYQQQFWGGLKLRI